LCTIVKPSSGDALVNGFDILKQPGNVRRSIGIVFQDPSVDLNLTGRENLKLHAYLYDIPSSQIGRRIAEVLALVRLEDRADSLMKTYSGGMRRRLELARGLLHHPKILFLDEPTSGVDPISRRNFWSLIQQMGEKGVTTFVTTHYMDEAEYCDRLGLIYRGELIALGTPEQLKTGQMPEEIVEVLCDRPQDIMELIEEIPGVRHAALFGRGLHVVVERAVETIPAISGKLSAAGHRASHPEKIAPSLEDVFVSLIEARDRMEAGQREFKK